MTKFELFLIIIMPFLCIFSLCFGYSICEKSFKKCGYELKYHYIPSTNWVEVIKIEKNI